MSVLVTGDFGSMNAIKNFVVFLGWVFFGIGMMFFVGFLVLVSAIGRAGFPEQGLNKLVAKSEHAVGVVELEGEIISSKDFRKQLKKLVDDEKIKSIVVRIDSPGGAVGASEEMYAAIKNANETKPVVCSMGSVAASGGFYAAMGCHKILANPGTLTGSIGVIMMTPNFGTTLSHYGFEMTVVKSGQFKDTGSPFRPVTAEDRKLLQDLVDNAYGQFVKVIADARGLSVEKVKSFADGRVLTGTQALGIGVIDELGDLDRAAKISLELAGDNEDPEIIMPKKPSPFVEWLEDSQVGEAISWLRMAGGAHLLYRAFL